MASDQATKRMEINRRKFIGHSLVGASLLSWIPQLVRAENTRDWDANTVRVERGDVILFQGDSITDHGRNRETADANNIDGLGRGYAMLASAHLLRQLPQLELQFLNRGVSGNKVHQLAERWEQDCLQLEPNVLSILIGVNDYWHTKTGGYTGTLQTYADDYRRLLDDTLTRLPKLKLIIGEPFAVNGIRAVTDDWYPDFDSYRQAAKDIASEYKAVFIPYQAIFDKASNQADRRYWTNDGVHTTLAGAQLMAEAWASVIR